MDIHLNQYRSEWRDQERRDKGREEKGLIENFVDVEMVKIEVEEEIWLQVRIVHDGGLTQGFRERKKRVWLELTG